MGQGGAGLPGASAEPADGINSALVKPLGGRSLRTSGPRWLPRAADGLSWRWEPLGMRKRVIRGELTARDAIRGSRGAPAAPQQLVTSPKKRERARNPRLPRRANSDHVESDRVKDFRGDFNKRWRSEGFHLECHIWTRPLQELLANNALRL